jgi:hypothetical protein
MDKRVQFDAQIVAGLSPFFVAVTTAPTPVRFCLVKAALLGIQFEPYLLTNAQHWPTSPKEPPGYQRNQTCYPIK